LPPERSTPEGTVVTSHPLASLALAGLLAATAAQAGEAEIRKNLPQRLKELPKIDEVSKTPVPGLYEVRVGHRIFYTDDNGDHLIDGNLIDTRSRTDITEQRLQKLTAITFADLPLKDALVMKQGSGARKLVVFGDPNCGYCKKLERELVNLKDVTIYTLLYPVLGPDSDAKSKDIWCAKDGQSVWRAWMVDGKPPPRHMGNCDASAIERNIAFGRKHRVNGTPALVFQDGTRIPGAASLPEIEKQLAQATPKS
jgi:thiol:disulfide interchange protein DsbC